MIIKQQIEIDLLHQGIMPRLNTMQNDANSRALEISLLKNGTPWEIPANVTAAVTYSKPDGTAGLYDTLPDGSAAYTISGNTVTIILAPQVLTAPGLVRVSVILVKDALQLTSFPLPIHVEAIPGAGAEKSEDYYHYTTFDALNQAIGNLSDLQTGDKTSLVAAVNEIFQGAGTGTVKSVNGVLPDGNGNVAIDITTAVSEGLDQAKASGAFDGKDGLSIFTAHITAGEAMEITVHTDLLVNNGYPVKIGDILLTDDGQIFTITSYEITLKPSGKKDFYYIAHFFSNLNGAGSTGGASVTIKGVSESTEDGGSNVVTFSDGKTLTVRNGKTGGKGDTPVKGADYFTDADKAEMVEDVLEALNSDAPEITITENSNGVWWNNNGVPEFFIPTDGTLVCSKETNYIKTALGDMFRLTTRTSNGWAANGAWYDAGKNVISVIIVDGDQSGNETVKLTAPAGAEYVRFFSHAYSDDISRCTLDVVFLGKAETPTSPLYGKKIVYDGDSICSSWGIPSNGGSYPQIIADIVGGTFDNHGVGGGRIVTQEGSSDSFHSVVDNLPNLPTDGDLYCFEGGVNDHWHSVPIGTFSESDYKDTLDKTTFCGALETIFRYATTEFVGKPICYIITHKCPGSAFTKYGDNTFADFRKAALGICEKYSIPVYDAWKDSGINSWNAAQLANFFTIDENTGTGDGTHPNEAGYRRYYVPQLIELFERIMPIGVTDVESPAEQTYTNVLETAGYTKGIYLSSGNESVDADAYTTGYIPCNRGDTVYLKNITMPNESGHGNRIGVYSADKSVITGFPMTSDRTDMNPVFDSNGNLVQFVPLFSDMAYIRISAWNIDETSIITVNEPIG